MMVDTKKVSTIILSFHCKNIIFYSSFSGFFVFIKTEDNKPHKQDDSCKKQKNIVCHTRHVKYGRAKDTVYKIDHKAACKYDLIMSGNDCGADEDN